MEDVGFPWKDELLRAMRKKSVSRIFKFFKCSCLSLSLVCVSGKIATEASSQPDPFPLDAQLRYNGSGAGIDGNTSVELRIPLNQTPENFFYLNPQVRIFNNGRIGSNLAVGYRSLNDVAKYVLGGYLAYDNRDTGSQFFQQISAGLEFFAEAWDMRLNTYLPVGKTNTQLGETFLNSGSFQGSQFLVDRDRRFDAALGGVELEAGTIITTGDTGYLRPYVGTYYYTGTNSIGALGIKGGLGYYGDLINAGLSIQNDRIFGTSILFNIGINLSNRSSKKATPPTLLERMNEPIARNSSVIVENQTVRDQLVAINPVTGQPYSFFVVADSTSGLSGNPNVVSFANFSTALANAGAAGANGVVYAYTPTGSTAPTLAGFTIPDGTKVVSSAPSLIPVSYLAGIGGTTFSNLPLPSGTGIYPIVNGTVTLAPGSNQILSGYDIRPNSPGVIGTNNVNATIVDNIIAVTTSVGNDRGIFLSGFSGNTNVSRNRISNAVSTGILLQNGSGNPTVNNNNVTITAPNTSLGFDGRGIILSNVAGTNTIVDGNAVSGAIGEGIRFDNVTGTASITNNTVLNTIQPDRQTELEASIFVRLGAGNINLNISGNTVGENNKLSTLKINGSSLVSNEIDGIEVSVCRLYAVDGIGGCPATTTAIVDITGNTVRNITSAAANADGIDINLSTNAIARFTISNNNLSNISDKGISFGADNASKGSAIISNNTFNRMGETGIQVRVAEASGATADLSSPITLGGVTTSGVVISGNQIANTGQSGIRLRTERSGQLTVTVNNNSITNANDGIPDPSKDEGGILVRTQDKSIIRATLTNNTVSNTSSTADSGGLLFRKQNDSNLCAKVQNNQSSNTAVVDYRFTQTGGAGRIQLSGIDTTITSTTLLQNALLAQGNTGASFGITGTVSIPNATCIFP